MTLLHLATLVPSTLNPAEVGVQLLLHICCVRGLLYIYRLWWWLLYNYCPWRLLYYVCRLWRWLLYDYCLWCRLHHSRLLLHDYCPWRLLLCVCCVACCWRRLRICDGGRCSWRICRRRWRCRGRCRWSYDLRQLQTTFVTQLLGHNGVGYNLTDLLPLEGLHRDVLPSADVRAQRHNSSNSSSAACTRIYCRPASQL